MADNIDVTPGTGKTVAADEIAGVLHQRVKISQGADGTAVDVSSAAPLEVSLANTAANSTAVKVDGSAVTQPVSLTSTTITGSALTALQLIDDTVFADDAAFTLSSSKSSVAGGVAVETDGTTPGTVSAENDAVSLRADRQRILLVNQTPPFLFRANENHATAQTNNELVAAPGASLSLYVTDIIISNGATAGTVKLVEDTAGTPADLAGPFYLAINGGVAMTFRTPIRLTANKNLGFTSGTVTTHTVTVLGYTAP